MSFKKVLQLHDRLDPYTASVLQIIMGKLEGIVKLDTGDEQHAGSIDSDARRECQYLLSTLSNLLSCLSHNGWVTLITQPNSHTDHVPDAEMLQGKLLI